MIQHQCPLCLHQFDGMGHRVMIQHQCPLCLHQFDGMG